jgi:hypothetical protein
MTFKTQSPRSDSLIWQSRSNPAEDDPYFNEWYDLMEAIRNDQPYNEVERGVMASLVTSMGRYATHTAQEITLEEMLNHPHEFAPNADKFTMDGPPPVVADANGLYPIPQPGIKKDREY